MAVPERHLAESIFAKASRLLASEAEKATLAVILADDFQQIGCNTLDELAFIRHYLIYDDGDGVWRKKPEFRA